MIGQTIDHYRIESKLGEGGMGVVYAARDTHLDRRVAIKVLPADKVADTGRKQRFVHEARAASQLNHPNIVTIYDIRSQDGIDFIVMELVEGRKLDGRSDIFSFGSVSYEMITGRRPFTGDSRFSILTEIVNQDPAPPAQIATAIPPELERIVLRCLRKDPARRYQTMADLK